MPDVNQLFYNNAIYHEIEDSIFDLTSLKVILDSICRINAFSAFVLDFDEHKLIYRTERLIYIDESGYSDILRDSPNPYWARVSDDTLEGLLLIRNNYPLMSIDIPGEEHLKHVCTIDYPIVIQQHQLYITQKFTPLQLRKDGITRYGLFVIKPSTKEKMECSIVKPDGDRLIFDFKRGKFEEYSRQFDLSKRELAILRRIKMGLTNQEIADSMFLSVNTVKTHRSRIFKKLGVNNITEAIAVVENYMRKE